MSPLLTLIFSVLAAVMLFLHGLAAFSEEMARLGGERHEHNGIETFTAARIGRAHAIITDYAREVDADLLVVGARGENTFLDLLVGSTAARVLRLAACPVLAVKNAGLAPYRQAFAALDFERASAAAPAFGLALAPQARIELQHVYDENIEKRMREAKIDTAFIADYRRRALAETETRLEAAQPEGGAFTRHVTTGYPAAAIVERVGSLRADLVILGRHGKSGMQEFLLGSVAKDVANAAECDVLALPPAASEAEKP